MKAIIYFVALGRASSADISAAKLISEHTSERVVFRNGTIAAQNSEAPEPCIAYAGLVPKSEAYETKPVFSVKDGKVVEAKASQGEDSSEELNSIGLPIGSPDSRKDLKEALEEAGIEFHGNAKTDTLAELYRDEVLVDGE